MFSVPMGIIPKSEIITKCLVKSLARIKSVRVLAKAGCPG